MDLAILVGCSKYDDDSISPLRFTSNDVQLVSGALEGACDLSSEAVIQLHHNQPANLRPTRSNIMRVLSRSRERNVERLVFFFSGHGFYSPETKSDYLLPEDAVPEVAESTALSIATVVEMLKQFGAKTTILFLDLCRAHARQGKDASDEWQTVRIQELQFKGIATFWSCSPGQRSYECEALQSGVFSYAVAQGFSEEGKCTTVYEMDRYLSSQVPALCKLHGIKLQNPYTQIEPLSIQTSPIVAETTYRTWTSGFSVGKELRNPLTSRLTVAPSSSEPCCGFDFGTSFSVAAINQECKSVLVPCPEGRTLVPSVVSFLPNLDYCVGWQAMEMGKIHPLRTFRNVKRLLGSGELLVLGDRTITPEFVASLVIRSLKANAEEFIGAPIYSAVISVPSNFSLAQRYGLILAYELEPVINFG